MPIGPAVLDKQGSIKMFLFLNQLGEFVEVETPGGIKEYEITEIKLI